ncbi:MAG: 6-pyruvoyl trahydropterin synthase family protein, partial [Spongiibacteraceae bacterium]
MPIERQTCIEISKEDLKFSAAHFTIFSATERERLHGHNFKVSLLLTADVGENGMCFSYVEIKKRLRKLCARIDEYTILPAHSPYMTIAERGQYY